MNAASIMVGVVQTSTPFASTILAVITVVVQRDTYLKTTVSQNVLVGSFAYCFLIVSVILLLHVVAVWISKKKKRKSVFYSPNVIWYSKTQPHASQSCCHLQPNIRRKHYDHCQWAHRRLWDVSFGFKKGRLDFFSLSMYPKILPSSIEVPFGTRVDVNWRHYALIWRIKLLSIFFF